MKKNILAVALIVLFVAGCAKVPTTSVYKNISAQQLKETLDKEAVFLVDVHIPEQRHIKGTDLFVPFDKIEQNKEKFPADKNTKIIVYCRSGNMSEESSRDLIGLGYTDVSNLLGGINAWYEAGYQAE